MMRDFNFDKISEPVGVDDLGTIRVSQEFGNVAVYVKIGENQWHTVYVDPKREETFIQVRALSDGVACRHPIVFIPRSFA
jgi:hypothetical protein